MWGGLNAAGWGAAEQLPPRKYSIAEEYNDYPESLLQLWGKK